MQGTRWAVAIFVLCLGWTSVRGQQVLSVSAGGLTRSYTTSDLLGRPDVRTVSTRRDDAYRQAMTYQAIFGDEERRLSQGTALPERQRVAGRGRVAGYPSPPFLAASVRGGMVTRWPRLSSNITPATLFRVVAAVDQP